MNSTLNFIDGHQISYIFALAAFAAPTRASALDEAVDVDISPDLFDEAFYLQPALKKARELLSPSV